MNRRTEYVHLQPYRPIPAPKLRPQKDRDAIAYGSRKAPSIRLSSKPAAPGRRVLYVVLIVLVMIAARWLWFHYLEVPQVIRLLHHP